MIELELNDHQAQLVANALTVYREGLQQDCFGIADLTNGDYPYSTHMSGAGLALANDALQQIDNIIALLEG